MADAFVQAAVALVPIILTVLVAAIRQRFKVEQIERVDRIAQASVYAVELISQSAGYDSRAKLAEAVRRARSLAASHGIQLSDEQWQTLIEAAVSDLQAFRREIKRPAGE
ncbi:hypothetical protein NITHO_4920012 [Nitrolancea hollandica Lb]|uniref:Phage holin, LL-H family n=2 Tax=Nitrolancea hollandica TaxID=1206749 RepID=I4EL39_9BACT|nr:hypothetical protein NITHO_4920012 [Nitrolancea hollandica Lb]